MAAIGAAEEIPTAATMTASQEHVLGISKFHTKCGKNVELSNDRRIASGKDCFADVLAFLNDPVPIDQKFSVKNLRNSDRYVSPICASYRPHTSYAHYTAGGAVHVVHCCHSLLL